MSLPLSSMQNFPEQVAGAYGAPRGRIRPRGSYSFAGVGDPIYGYAGYGAFLTQYPGIISGQSGYGDMSTTTGVPVGTPSEESMEKVGGGPAGADTDDAAPTQGMSQGGTAAY
jgi:hypothetical protein